MRRPLLFAALLAVSAFAVLTGDATVLTALPVLGLFAMLAGGGYVGEAAYVRRLTARARPRRSRPLVVARSRVAARPRGAALLGRRMARRGPPALLAA